MVVAEAAAAAALNMSFIDVASRSTDEGNTSPPVDVIAALP